jgi:S-adenosylmethionine hydrolase
VGTERKIVAVAGSQMIFIAPDNGLLYPLLDGLERPEMWEITWRPESKEISATFHGRDIFAPVAGMLACGTPLRRVAKPVRSIKPFHIPRPRSAGGEISGEVIYVDNFGNLMINVSREFLRQERGGRTAGLTLSIGKDKIRGVSDSYASAEKGEAVLVFNSYDMLEIAVNQGSASEKFKARPGTKIKVSRN